MEQNEINIEKQELVKRIKDDCNSKLNLSKWLSGFCLGIFVVELVWKLINGTVIEDLTTLLVILLLTVINIIPVGGIKKLIKRCSKSCTYR